MWSFALVLAPILMPVLPPQPPDRDQPVLHEIAQRVDPLTLKASITRLVGFGTRHTLSATNSRTRGIGAARRWVGGTFRDYSKACGGCLEVQTPSMSVTGPRVPAAVTIENVLAIQRGTTDPDRVVIIAGHLDSRVSDPMDATSDAPGADDDGSGVAAVLEAARVLSRYKFPATIVYAVLSGEEQGLYGGKLLAQVAEQQHWRVEADLNNDIIGNTHGQGGTFENGYVRVFSEGTKALETPAEGNDRRYQGGEVDSPSRQLGRYLADLADHYLAPFRARMVYRTDRYGRGGDQTPLLEAGYPAVRLTEASENYDRQHQDLRSDGGIDYGDVAEALDVPYLAQVTRLNLIALASLAAAPAPPDGVTVSGAVSADTTLAWSAVRGAANYRVWWRDTTEPRWRHFREAGSALSIKLDGVVIDDWFFGVQAVSSDGYASPVVFPGAAGAFGRSALVPPP